MFNEQTERFYYVSDYYDTINSSEGNDVFNNNVAVLIYYNNTYRSGTNTEVVIANTQSKVYNTSNYNYQGPKGLITYLPKTTEWSNVSLTVLARQMRSDAGSTKVNNGAKALPIYSYAEYSTRLLTLQEVNRGCGLNVTSIQVEGALDTQKCRFLVENTIYSLSGLVDGIWLETPDSTNTTGVWTVFGNTRDSHVRTNSTNTGGVRPAIEVSKSDISY